MLVNQSESFVKSTFATEAELEEVVQTYAEQLFGSAIIYLSQTRITTQGGRGTIPDAIVLDVATGEWYVVEAERAIHGTWEHIAPQVSRHLAAISAPQTMETIINLTLGQLRSSPELRDMFRDLGITELETYGHLQWILRKPPTIAIPIDRIPKDLTEWAQTLRNSVKIWVIEKYVSTADPARVLYSLPDENFPTLSTTPVTSGAVSEVRIAGSQPFQELIAGRADLVGKRLRLEYGPRGGGRQTYWGTLRTDGIEVDGKVYSPSYAAVYCINKAGSARTTANGWIMWRTDEDELLNDVYMHLRSGLGTARSGEPGSCEDN